jgi:hypothetical protein
MMKVVKLHHLQESCYGKESIIEPEALLFLQEPHAPVLPISFLMGSTGASFDAYAGEVSRTFLF